MPDAFLTCLRENVAELKGYGKKRVDAAGEAYIRIRDSRIAAGEDHNTAGYEAMARVMDDINLDLERKHAALRTNTNIMADARRRLIASEKVKVLAGGGMATRVGAALRSLNEDVHAIADAPSLNSEEYRLKSRYQAMMAREAPNMAVRRRWGFRPTKDRQRDLVREMVEGVGASGNPEAKAAAKTLRAIFTMAYANMRRYGVNVRPFSSADTLPIGISPVRLLQNNKALAGSFVPDMYRSLDWANMMWPDGRRVLPADQELVLKAARNAITTGGKQTGYASQFGEDLEKAFLREVNDQRFFRFKDGEAWQVIHDKYADGDVFQTMQSTLEHVVREEAKARIYGPDPDRMVATVAAQAQKYVLDKHVSGSVAADKAIKDLNPTIRDYHAEAVMALRSNPMDPNNPLANAVGATANMLSAAQLGSALVANTMGDAVNVITFTMAEHRGVHSLIRTAAEYIKGMMPGNAYPSLMNTQRSGYVIDDLVYNNIQTARYTMGATLAPSWTKAWARVWAVAGGVPRHTNAFRASVNKGVLLDMAHWRGTKMGDLPEAAQRMLGSVGLTAEMWERVRADMAIMSDRPGIDLYDTIGSYDTLSLDLAERMHRMQVNEVNAQVLMPTNEAANMVRRGLRPDSLSGALLSSMSMYTAQPLAASMHLVRVVMNAQMSATGRTAVFAGAGIAMVATGALALQIRNVINGREIEPMDNPAFWGRAMISGGVFNIFGSYMTGLGEGDANAVYKQIAGPIFGLVTETTIAAGETAFQMAGLSDKTDGLRHLATVFERYIGPKPFYAAAVLSREVYERLKEIADPVGYKRSVSTRINNAKQRGQIYVPKWKPSDRPITELIQGR